ncbi:MAG: hypothetical protein M0Z27_06280 [Thermaerobacter sp.]|nr:hypothetical protein [Thermaerobacter sp.]
MIRQYKTKDGKTAWQMEVDLGRGINRKRIGHSQIGLTVNVYGHLLPETDRAAAAALDDYLGRDNTPGK